MIPGDPLAARNPDGTQSSVLRNKFGITDPCEFEKIEYEETDKRQQLISKLIDPELRSGRINMSLYNLLRQTHKVLFGNIYDWAGQTREVNIAKRSPSGEISRFTYIESLGTDPSKLTDSQKEKAAQQIKKLIDEAEQRFRQSPKNDRKQIAAAFARMIADLNEIHPFREGNGRAIRETVRQMALMHGVNLDYSNMDKNQWIGASVKALNGNYVPMTMLIESRLEPDITPDIKTCFAELPSFSPSFSGKAFMGRLGNDRPRSRAMRRI